MTKFEVLSLALMAISNLVFVISLVFLFLQVREVRKQMKRDSFGKYWARWIEFDRFFVEHPHLRPYFYEGQSLPEDSAGSLNRQLESISEMILDHFASMYFNRDVIETREELSVYRGFMRSMYQNQPCFQSFVDNHIHWYSSGFKDFICSKEPKLPPSRPTRPIFGGFSSLADAGEKRIRGMTTEC